MTAYLFWKGICIREVENFASADSKQIRTLARKLGQKSVIVTSDGFPTVHTTELVEMCFCNPRLYLDGLAFFSEEEV